MTEAAIVARLRAAIWAQVECGYPYVGGEPSDEGDEITIDGEINLRKLAQAAMEECAKVYIPPAPDVHITLKGDLFTRGQVEDLLNQLRGGKRVAYMIENEASDGERHSGFFLRHYDLEDNLPVWVIGRDRAQKFITQSLEFSCQK